MKNWQKKAFERFPENWFRDIDGDGYDANERERDAYLAGIDDTLKSIWHKPDEPIEHDEEVLIEYETGFHDAACYDKDEDVFYTGAFCPKRNDITRWAYIKDITQL